MSASGPHTEDLMRRGISLHQAGRLDEARGLYEETLRAEPRHFKAWHLLGVAEYQANRPEQALHFLAEALRIDPNSALAHNHHANALLALGKCDEAIGHYDRAVSLKPDYAEALYNRGNAYFDLGQFQAAIDSFGDAIDYKSDHTLAYNNRGLAKFCLKRYAAAVADHDAVLAIDPGNAEAHNYRGHALREAADLQNAVASYDAAIALRPDYSEAHNGRGSTLALLKQFDAALLSYDLAIAFTPRFAGAHVNRGHILKVLRRWREALASYDLAIAADPRLVEAHLNRGNVLKELKQWGEALASFDAAVATEPGLAEAHFGRGDTLRYLGRYEAAAEEFDRALALDPRQDFLLGLRCYVNMGLCDWRGLDADRAELTRRIELGEAVSPPFPVLALSGSAALQRKAAEIWVRETCAVDQVLPPISAQRRPGRIRLGYFSADFRNHPVSYLTAELFERHDRSRFELIGFSLGPVVQDDMRRRLLDAFEHFVDVNGHSDQDIAALARAMDLDIAVDLSGFTEGSKPALFALRVARLQLSYLGYLGTLAAPFMDYLIADAILVPTEARQFYAEKLLYLPSYQSNDTRRRIADTAFSREELGLPAQGFVFCCFNSHYKITPETFAGWMRILHAVPHAVLHLYSDGMTAERNLRREADMRNVDSTRLIFGGRLDLPEYLARYRAADLFLDTSPYNAGTTASDALWAGLPVLTLAGESFAGRIAASLLTAIEMPELIASTPQEYEQRAIDLGSNPERVAVLKQKLANHRLTTPLFDIGQFTRHLESGYISMHNREQGGLLPDHMHVFPSGAG